VTDDLVKRLREEVNDHMFGIIQSPLQLEAANRIEQLEAALRLWLQYDESYEDFVHMITDYEEALEATRAALGEKKDG
jgi:hypothetical protein